jgi:short-subunit dehydrogenase
MKLLEGKIALITGASKGIGRKHSPICLLLRKERL